MDVTNEFQKVGVFLAHNGFVSVLKEMARTLMLFIEGNRISGHEFAHDLAEGGRAGAQEKVKMIRDQGPGPREIGYRISRGKRSIGFGSLPG